MQTSKFALIEGIVAGAFFGSAAILIRFMPSLGAFDIAFWRLIIAAAALTLILLFLRKPFDFRLVRNNLKELAVLGVFLGLHFVFFVSAVKDTTILNATVLVNTTPLFSVIISSFIFRAKPSRSAMLGLVVSFIGIAVIAYAQGSTLPQIGIFATDSSLGMRGNVEATLAAVVEAFYLNLGRGIRSRMKILPTMLPIYLITAGVVSLLSVFASSKISFAFTNYEIILPLLGLGILPTALSHTLYFSSLSNLKSFETATLALLEPIGATLLGIAIFQETPALPFVAGAILILLGILFVVKEKL